RQWAIVTGGMRMRRAIVEGIERAVIGTPIEGVARRIWSECSSIGHPRARQSLRYDRQTQAIMERVLRRDSNCVDVGCHRGKMLTPICKLAPQGTHFAFEPLPRFCDGLRKRFPTVQAYEVALSDRQGLASFCDILDNPGLSSFLKPKGLPAAVHVEEIFVRTERLDDVIPQDCPIDFIKVDVEGAQQQVFRGATATITRNRPFIVFEHDIRASNTYNVANDTLYDLLVDDCALEISLLEDWLSAKPPLDRATFDRHVGRHPDPHFYFLAHPP
ncbi:MAG: FkbM family methyltransferase, partial [Geminicoccaceae bacterium]